jgi:hypothetical protein
VARSMQRLRATPNRVASKAHKPPSEGDRDARGRGRSALRAIIRALEAKLRGS